MLFHWIEYYSFYPRSILAYSPLENIQNTFILTIIIILILGTIGNYIHAIAYMRDCEKSKFILL